MTAQIKPFSWRRHSRDVLDFQRETYQLNFPEFICDRHFLHNYAGQLRRAVGNPSEGVFVLEADRRAQGFLWIALISTMIDPCIGYIKNVYVAPELRRMGWGRRLLAHAETWCLGKGVTRICLDASCCNERALGIYQRAGYETVRMRMEKELDPAALGELQAELNRPALMAAEAAAHALEVS